MSTTCSSMEGQFSLFCFFSSLHDPLLSCHQCPQMVLYFHFHLHHLVFCHGNRHAGTLHSSSVSARASGRRVFFPPSHFSFAFTWMTWLPEYFVEYRSLQEMHDAVVSFVADGAPSPSHLGQHRRGSMNQIHLSKQTWRCAAELAFASHANRWHATVRTCNIIKKEWTSSDHQNSYCNVSFAKTSTKHLGCFTAPSWRTLPKLNLSISYWSVNTYKTRTGTR